MAKPLITGATNIIAIDNAKKEKFVNVRKEAVQSMVKQNPIPEQSILPQEPIHFGLSASQMQVPNQNISVEPQIQDPIQNVGESLTNADVLSQSFTSNNDYVNTPEVNSQIKSNAEIISDLMKIQDDIDKVLVKLIRMEPDKEIIQSVEPQPESFVPAQEELINSAQSTGANLIQDIPTENNAMPFNQNNNDNTSMQQVSNNNEVIHFNPNTPNIFDEPRLTA